MDHGQDNTVLGFHEGGWIRGELHAPSGGGPRREQSEIGMPECCALGLVCIFISRVAAGSVTQAVVLSLIAFGMGPHSSWNLHKRYPTTHCQKLRRTVGKCPVSARLSRCWRPSFFAVSPGGVWRAVHALPGWPPSTTTPQPPAAAATGPARWRPRPTSRVLALAAVGLRFDVATLHRTDQLLYPGHIAGGQPGAIVARRSSAGLPCPMKPGIRNPEPGTRNPESSLGYRNFL